MNVLTGNLIRKSLLLAVACGVVVAISGCSRSVSMNSNDNTDLTPVSAVMRMGLRDAEWLWITEAYPGSPPKLGIILLKAESPSTWDRILLALEGALSLEITSERPNPRETTHMVQFNFHGGPSFPFYYRLKNNELVAEQHLLLGLRIHAASPLLLTREERVKLAGMKGKYMIFKMPRDFPRLLQEIETATGKLP